MRFPQQVRAADVAKLVSQAWKNLSDTDRMQWVELGRRDRERYEREKAAYKGPWKIPALKSTTTEGAPKKPMSAFLAFGNERRGLIAEANPTLSNTEISSLLSKLWKECPKEIKQAYRDREARERVEFKRKLAEWEAKRDAALVSEYQQQGAFAAVTIVTPDVIDETSHETTLLSSQQSLLQCDEPISYLRQEPGPTMGLSFQQQQQQQSQHTLAAEQIPSEIVMPTFMVSQETMDEYLPDEAWPFNRIPTAVPMAVPSTPVVIKPSPRKRLESYTMEDLLQDEELFFEDFSPSQVEMGSPATLTRQTSLSTLLAL